MKAVNTNYNILMMMVLLLQLFNILSVVSAFNPGPFKPLPEAKKCASSSKGASTNSVL